MGLYMFLYFVCICLYMFVYDGVERVLFERLPFRALEGFHVRKSEAGLGETHGYQRCFPELTSLSEVR